MTETDMIDVFYNGLVNGIKKQILVMLYCAVLCSICAKVTVSTQCFALTQHP